MIISQVFIAFFDQIQQGFIAFVQCLFWGHGHTLHAMVLLRLHAMAPFKAMRAMAPFKAMRNGVGGMRR